MISDYLPDKKLCFSVAKNGTNPTAEKSVCVAFTIAKGELAADEYFYLVDSNSGKKIEYCHVRCTSKWSDGSCRWILVNALVTVSSTSEREYCLFGSDDALVSRQKSVDSDACNTDMKFDMCIVGMDDLRYDIDLGQPQKSDDYIWYVKRDHYQAVVELGTGKTLHISVVVTHDLSVSSTDIVVLLHNRSAAQHQHGLWDLGDSSSVLFKSITLEMDIPNGAKCGLLLSNENNGSSIESSSFKHLSLTQHSSGGTNDRSAVHMDKAAKIPFSKTGYELIVDGQLSETGARAKPIVTANDGDICLSIQPLNFWQMFPSAIRITPDKLFLDLFCAYSEGCFELQPGERISKSVVLSETPASNLVDESSSIEFKDVNYIGVVANKCVLEHSLEPVTPFDIRLMDFLCGPDEFLNKRESLDEYGWRNFGEVFADHESLYVEEGSPPLASHYNNQYDLIMGFGLQYMRTNDVRWRDLMNDLVKHVIEIDIYKTNQDRVEYNNGLFWHTNHYENAETATHRTFSIKNYNPLQPQGSSGGPGAEHCYTTGLALHYFLTGDHRSADEVVSLATWVDAYLNANSCLMANLHSIAKNELPRIIKLIRGKKLPVGRYPFTRGTGNYLRACLDAFAVSGDSDWINKADNIVVNTFDSKDDIDLRNLEDIENTWFHTIYLQEVVRYLIVKNEMNAHDRSYIHAQSALVHYLRWMLAEAVPYLDKPELLEFVNDTWAAQDVRRYMLLMTAVTLDSENSKAYEEKANYFARRIEDSLSSSPTINFTRIQAILLQNACKDTCLPSFSDFTASDTRKYRATIAKELKIVLRKLWNGVFSFSLAAEMHWIRSRW